MLEDCLFVCFKNGFIKSRINRNIDVFLKKFFFKKLSFPLPSFIGEPLQNNPASGFQKQSG